MAKLNEERATWIYKKMNDIRNFEDQVHQIFATGSIPGFVHLYAGEEAVAVGVCAHLTDDDYITSTHRGHGHCIAKDCSLDHMMAEIYGKETGLCKGKGGSMHIADIDKGMLGANGMVGGGFPIAIGAALRNQYLKTKDVVVCFFGDGAANEGTFHESINMASIWKLPVVFVNENNSFGEATPQWYSSGSKKIADRGSAYGIPSETVDGKDLMAVYEAAGKAIERARKGEGPTLVECRTYRNYGHFEGDEQKYKATTGKESEFAKRDCIKEFREYALAQGLLSEESATEIEENSAADIKHAVKFAEESDIPKPETLYQDVFAD
ncbi:thiamine pyrophosphate-dependent dehydrogenase E1 component subunit alpha [Liquorilactobacillus satsumensis]|nr:thiamine pyrophosphate-dependent dehydrogenase E1 component subunit alpha [Liquorilactobacillus satsumensis]MCC7667670.1 ABC transporter substrate-binding protein [Liquorilactobacillus satsumensis]MCP9312279.1 thiamine pyrophosphate-dependent dehydrogenase E1 component subunit alpha [Liquorilactobacillus satsumensis]MCP9328784.1 thiamine pyrophosphate-dependent dehydrogenase E1 component subunit alpha [Liquorilactobacillus satsumensis]MCP9357168.1 thiamine pyrophosphate-dependent dehydrogena